MVWIYNNHGWVIFRSLCDFCDDFLPHFPKYLSCKLWNVSLSLSLPDFGICIPFLSRSDVLIESVVFL